MARFFQIAIDAVIVISVGVALFGITMDMSHLPALLVILMLGVLSLVGLGLAGASSFSLLNAKRWGSNPVNWIVDFAVTPLAGVYFPPSVLPVWLQKISEWLPHTRTLRSARYLLSGQAILGDPSVMSDITYLLRFTAVSLPIGAALFAWGMRKPQREGALSRWS